MSMPVTLTLQIVVMFLLVGVGFAMFRTGKISMEGNRTIGNILVYLSLPCVIVKGLMVERTAENVFALGVSAVVGFVALLVSALVARLILREDAIGNFSATFSNPSFFGIPLVTSILGQGPVFYMTTYIAFMNLGQWTYGVSLLTGKRGKVSLKTLLCSPFMVATVIGLVLFATQIQLPGVVTSCLDYVSALNTPLAMFAIGVYLAQAHLADMLHRAGLYKVSLSRLLVAPLVTLAILCLLPESLLDLKLAILIAQACPVGLNVAVYAQLHDADYVYAVETIVVSVLLSIVSIPLVVGLAQMLWM
jgi:predicted permease